MFQLILEFYLTLTVPLVYLFGLILIAYSPDNPMIYQTISGLILSFLGLVLWIGSYLSLRFSLTVLPKAQKLVTTGPYRYFSHPMYLGIAFVFLGLSLATNSIPGFFYTILIVILLNIFRAKKEEETLLKKFGQKYKEYKKKVIF